MEDGNHEYMGGADGGEAPAHASAAAATERGQEGKFAVTNTRSSMDPFLTYSTERDLREKVWRTYYSRGDNGDEYDNNAIIAQIRSPTFGSASRSAGSKPIIRPWR